MKARDVLDRTFTDGWYLMNKDGLFYVVARYKKTLVRGPKCRTRLAAMKRTVRAKSLRRLK